MSLVGTRPPTVDEWDKYELHHRARLATKPGLTGMWQVSGRSNITDFEEVVKLDKQYISEWTMGLDMRRFIWQEEYLFHLDLAMEKNIKQSFVSYLMGRRKLLIVQKMKIDELFAVINADDYYKEDKDYVVKSFARLIEAGVYQKNLFEDLK